MINIEKKLTEIIGLLVDTNADNWVDSLSQCKKELSVEPTKAISNILSMYGAVGSLNDVVLYKNGQLLLKENTEFDDLRADLYDYCKKINDT